MNTDDLEIFLLLAATQNMQQAAIVCNKSPSMLSKSLKRLEKQLGVALFDRIGKRIQLNGAGIKLRGHAASIVAQTKQTLAQYTGLVTSQTYTIAAPSILLFRWASVVAKVLRQHSTNAGVHFNSYFEQQALDQLIQGSADLAIITTNISSQIPDGMYSQSLGGITMQVAAGKSHPLVLENSRRPLAVSAEQLLAHPFVSPTISPYCGQAGGSGCDGWRNDIFPRNLSIVANDYAVLGQLVRSGQALAYLPDYLLRELDLVQLHITNCDYTCQEQLLIVSHRSDLADLFSDEN